MIYPSKERSVKKSKFRIMKTFLLTLLAGAFSMVGLAQQFTVGLRPGLNLSHYWGEDVSDGTGRIIAGANFGAFFTYRPIEQVGVTAEVNFAQRGASTNITVLGFTYRGVQRLNYLEIPLYGQFYFLRTDFFRPSVYFGPVVSILTNARYRIKEPVETNGSNTDNFANADLGLLFGADFQMNFGQFSIHPGLRYQLGLIDVPADSPASYKNGTLQISVGVGYNF